MEQVERDALDRYLAGDPEALAELIERYRRPLYGFILKMTEGRGDADELYQETWMRTLRKLPTFRPDNLLGWLFRVAHNLVIDEARRQARFRDPADRADADMDRVPDPSPDPGRRAASRDLGRRIAAAVQALPADQRAVFLMRTEAGLPFREIARVQAIPLNTALARMHYAVGKLRQALHDDWNHLDGETS